MKIDRIVIDGWKRFTFDIDFNDGMNILIGMNGCGKTTILDLIAGLTGTDRATELLTGTFKFIRLDVSWEPSPNVIRRESITLEGEFHAFDIGLFKRKLPVRTSYVLCHDLGDNRYLGETADRAFNARETIDILRNWDMDLKRSLRCDPNRIGYMVSETGAQRMLLTLGMRLPPLGVPMLVDMPERSLHIILRRRIHDFYARYRDEQQVIYATHCPELVCSVMDRIDVGNWHNQSPSQRPKNRALIDLHAAENTTLRDDYNVPL